MSEKSNTTSPLRAHRRRGQRLTAEEKRIAMQKFLDSFRLNANVTLACKLAGIDRSQIYRWQEHHETFAFEFKQAELAANDMLLAAAWQRGVSGVAKPVVSIGKQVFIEGKNGKPEPLMERVYSDSLLALLMKARMPEFREKQSDVNVNVNTQAGTISIDTRAMNADQLARLKQLAMEMKAGEK